MLQVRSDVPTQFGLRRVTAKARQRGVHITCACARMRGYMCVHGCMCACVHVCMCACVHVRVHVRAGATLYACARMRVGACSCGELARSQAMCACAHAWLVAGGLPCTDRCRDAHAGHPSFGAAVRAWRAVMGAWQVNVMLQEGFYCIGASMLQPVYNNHAPGHHPCILMPCNTQPMCGCPQRPWALHAR